jgi:hypothetical protein
MESETPQTGNESSSPPINNPSSPQSIYPSLNQPTVEQSQTGLSASQLGLNQSMDTKPSMNPKKLLLRGLIGFILLGALFAVLVFTNIIALNKFKTVEYTNSSGTKFSLAFYTKHSTKSLKSGNTQLVSKVSEDGKYPLALSIATGEITTLDKNGIKECSGPLPKEFEVQNNNLNQKISVCSFPSTNGSPSGVYVMGFASNNKANIVTISQDLSGVDLSSQSGAQQSLPKFGLDSYQDDIKKIVASINVK